MVAFLPNYLVRPHGCKRHIGLVPVPLYVCDVFLFVPCSLVSRLVDARVLGKNEEAVEQYDLMVSADLPYLGNQTFAVSMMADSRRHYVVKDLATLYGMIKGTQTLIVVCPLYRTVIYQSE